MREPPPALDLIRRPNLEHHHVEILSGLRQKLVGHISRNVQQIPGRNVLPRSSFNGGSTHFAGPVAFPPTTLPPRTMGAFPVPDNIEIRQVLVDFGPSRSFPMDHNRVEPLRDEIFMRAFGGVNFRTQFLIQSR
jgi:hypothetical protein